MGRNLAIVFTDIHCYNWPTFSTVLPNGRNSRFQISLNILAQIKKYALENNIQHVLFGGDMFEVRKQVTTDVLSTVFCKLQDMAKSGLHLGLLVGNHDQYDIQGSHNSLNIMKSFATVMDRPGWYELPGGVSVQACPFTEDYEAIKNMVGTAPPSSTTSAIRMLHAGIQGAKLSSVEYQMEEKITPEEIQSLRPMLTMVGHYHLPQDLGGGIVYPGAPNPMNFGDPPVEDRGFIVADLDAQTYQRVAIEAPQFITIKLEKLQSYAPLLSGHFVRVNVTKQLSNSDQHDVEELLTKSGTLDYTMNFDLSEQKDEAKENRTELLPTMSFNEMVEKYVEKQRGLEIVSHLDLDLLKKLGTNIVNKILHENA